MLDYFREGVGLARSVFERRLVLFMLVCELQERVKECVQLFLVVFLV
jgi:hypothetical protein